MTAAMKRLKELKDRQSRERQRMAELGLADELTDETRAELDTIERGTPDLERLLRAAQSGVEDEERAALVTETGTADPAAREREELRSRASLTNYLLAAARGRMVDGAEAELSAAAGVAGIPMELWDVPDETRAVAEAPGTVGVNLDSIRPFVFAHSIAPRLGIEMPRVMSGTYASATITTSQSAGPRAKGAAQAGTAGGFAVTTATPKSVSARLELTIEDIAAVGQAGFESVLRENLSMKLSDALDDQMINGDGAPPNLAGIFNRLGNATAPGAAVATFDDFVAIYAAGIDGLWANVMKEVGIVAGVSTYRVAAATYRDRVIDTGQRGGVSLGDTSFADYAMAMYGGLWTNKRMPAAANDIQNGILYRMGRTMAGGAGAMRTAVCPHWNEVSIDDIYSGSASGERYFTLHAVVGDVILVQPDAYDIVAFRTAV